MQGLRPLDPRHDFPEIVGLIELGFREEMDPLGQKLLAQMRRRACYGIWSQLLWGGPLNLEGFVWEEQGRVVGNLSLRRALPAWNDGRIIGNVVVHPECRGRGIARALMQAAEATSRTAGARWLGLEVRADNAAAYALYTHLGFRAVGAVEHFLHSGTPWPRVDAPRTIWRRSQPLDRLLWAGLAEKTMSRIQAQVLEIRPDLYTFGGFERILDLWFNREREMAWIEDTPDPQLAVSIQTDLRRRFHVWELLVSPDADESRVQEAVSRAFASVSSHRHWPVVTFVNSKTVLANVLQQLGFVRHRLLTQMYRVLD
ncbi:MAG: GNAT family N-acetyltransferase [Anaerolineae bacterium]|nr:GNAT family N-acetyltransferase [Anaerolineae bacterium]